MDHSLHDGFGNDWETLHEDDVIFGYGIYYRSLALPASFGTGLAVYTSSCFPTPILLFSHII